LPVFVRRAEELRQEPAAQFAWHLYADGSGRPDAFPTVAELKSLLALIRQFFLLKDLSVDRTLITLGDVCKDHADLTDAIKTLSQEDPFAAHFKVTIGGKAYEPRELTEAWASRYFHSDRTPPTLEGLASKEWKLLVFPLCLFFHRGFQIVFGVRAIILEAHRRGLIPGDTAA